MTWEEFRAAALNMGFAQGYSVCAKPFARWDEIQKTHIDPHWARLYAAARDLLPQARAIVVLVWAYRPYVGFPAHSPQVDAFYPASQNAYMAARALASSLRDAGYAADDSQAVPAKWALLRTGEAFFGRNALTALPRFGTRYCIQTILTDAPFPTIDRDPESELDPRCEGCDACVHACPTGTLDRSGRVSMEKCLRAQPYADVVPERFRPLFGASLLGCDLCQRVCPRNAREQTVPPPRALMEALKLERLLAGDVKPLAAWIGANYARPSRVQGRAAILTANLNRGDMLPALEALGDTHPMPYVREHARWAQEQLRKGGKDA